MGDYEITNECIALLKQGRTLARQGAVSSAIEKYTKMLDLAKGVQNNTQRQGINQAALGDLAQLHAPGATA